MDIATPHSGSLTLPPAVKSGDSLHYDGFLRVCFSSTYAGC